jgi:hypothetical protein
VLLRTAKTCEYFANGYKGHVKIEQPQWHGGREDHSFGFLSQRETTVAQRQGEAQFWILTDRTDLQKIISRKGAEAQNSKQKNNGKYEGTQ